ncbi:MAG: hypothetical protein COW65_08545 [Cytophagales bacterium CG18_big_fil_WC_8_21_14_2_50_42_9]|nr:MAG: hypothetical protein COW65_08545 [Cytophagales bacterium CG18_big_fil_WC_8_21_14_2_50_42_9]
MKIRLLSIVLICFVFAVKSFAQESDGVENVHSIKATIIPYGVGYGYEHALSRRVTLNTELMLSGGLMNRFGLVLTPTLRLEPRFYYNYLKRAQRGQKVLNNSANFLSLSIENGFSTYIKDENVKTGTNMISVIPKWGQRRAIGQHFFFEWALGVGASYNKLNKFKVAPGIDVRFGYAF